MGQGFNGKERGGAHHVGVDDENSIALRWVKGGVDGLIVA